MKNNESLSSIKKYHLKNSVGKVRWTQREWVKNND